MVARPRASSLSSVSTPGYQHSLSTQLVPSAGGEGRRLVMRFLVKTGLKDRAFLGAFYVAFPNAMITLTIRLLASGGHLPWIEAEPEDHRLLNVQTAVWTGIVGGLSFLVVLRASQAYTRFWQAITAVHLLQIEWMDAFSALLAFCCTSSAPRESCQHFKHVLARLFSLYHAAALLRLVEPGVDDDAISEITVLDPFSLGNGTTEAYLTSTHRLELVGQWIQVAIMHGMRDQVVVAPPPLVSRCFQELANGNVKFQDALKVKSIPFPQTYQLVCDILLFMHWCATPFFTSLWVNSPTLSATLAFFAVFTFWSLTFVARSIENPFCTQHFIREAVTMQDEMNTRLLTLLHPTAAEVPRLVNASDEQLESDSVTEMTIGTFWAVSSGAKPNRSAQLAAEATHPSKVNFVGGAIRAFRGSGGKTESPRREILGHCGSSADPNAPEPSPVDEPGFGLAQEDVHMQTLVAQTGSEHAGRMRISSSSLVLTSPAVMPTHGDGVSHDSDADFGTSGSAVEPGCGLTEDRASRRHHGMHSVQEWSATNQQPAREPEEAASAEAALTTWRVMSGTSHPNSSAEGPGVRGYKRSV